MTPEYWINEDMTKEQALKFIRRQRGKNMTLFISVGQEAPILDKPDRIFKVCGNVEVTMPAALKFIDFTYSDSLCSRGALVHISGLGQCIFIGRAA